MPLTASDHLKISALQQVANMVGQMQSVQGNPQVAANVVNNLLPLIQQFESSDPEFQELGIWLRQARAAGPQGPPPHVIANIAGQAQRMIALVRTGLPYRTNAAGERVIWDPIRGLVSSPLFEEGEPVRPNSVYDWRGSKKYPFGKAFPDWNLIEGWDISSNKVWVLISALAAIAGFFYIKNRR
jgi:hypothetical protein